MLKIKVKCTVRLLRVWLLLMACLMLCLGFHPSVLILLMSRNMVSIQSFMFRYDLFQVPSPRISSCLRLVLVFVCRLLSTQIGEA